MSLRRVIEHSIAATVSENTMDARRNSVRALQPTHLRLAVQSVDAAVFLIPALKLGVDRLAMRRKGLRFIGSGAESSVYSDGEHVLKYVKGSELLDDKARRELSDKKEAEFDQVRTYMSAFVLDQTIDVAPHAIKKGKEVVQTTQVHTQFDGLLEIDDRDGLVLLHDGSDGVSDELSDFIDAAWRLYGKTGLLPDTNGTDNVVQSDGHVLLLDTQPITIEQASVQRAVMHQLGVAASLLERIS